MWRKTRASKKELHGIEIPIINQPEVSILGFIIALDRKGWRWLLQAKAELGNEDIVQLAPTVQATYSNYSQKHGGNPTPYLDYFLDQNQLLLTDSLQSEQGTKFLLKYNRNCVCNADVQAMEQNYQGFSIEDIQEALKTDFSINTDARSVIATSPWGLMALQDTPFSQARGEGEFWSDLYASYNRVVDNEYIDQIQQKIKDLRVLVALETSICQLIDSHLMRAKS